MIDGGKMSKSLGNAYTLADLAKQGISPLAYRYFVLGAHYSSPLNFTWEAVQGAQNAFNRLVDTVRTWDQPTEVDSQCLDDFMTYVSNDLDTVQGLALVWRLVSDDNLSSGVKAATLLAFDGVLGLALEDVVARPLKISPEIQVLLDERAQARLTQDFASSDRLRDQIAKLGLLVEDTSHGQRVREVR